MLTEILTTLVSLAVLYFLFWKVYFLRDPERIIPSGRLLVSPADGRILKIIRCKKKHQKIEKGMFGKINTLTSDVSDPGYIVSIFMSPFNVHINRAPVAGKVVSVKHTRGKFFNAGHFEKSLMNEKSEMVMQNNAIGNIKVIQIAGFLARRIECFVKPGHELKKGQRFGLINLGSQVTMILPKNVNLTIKEGDKVKAGSSIIGEY